MVEPLRSPPMKMFLSPCNVALVVEVKLIADIVPDTEKLVPAEE